MRLRSARARALGTALLVATAGASAPLLAGGLAGAARQVGKPARHAGKVVRVVADKAGSYAGVLATAAHRSLYVLSTESGGHLHCTGSACLTVWPPLLVPAGASAVRGAGVRGRFGFAARQKGGRQLTYNGYPVYTFSGDSGPNRSSGQGIKSFGGTWTLVRASAKTARTTPYRSTVRTGSKRSPTTTSGYSYGY